MTYFNVITDSLCGCQEQWGQFGSLTEKGRTWEGWQLSIWLPLLVIRTLPN